MFYLDPWWRKAVFHSRQQPSAWPQAHHTGHKRLGRGGCSTQHRQAMLYPVELVPFTHGADAALRNTLGEARTVERNQNTEEEVILNLSSFSDTHNCVNVVPSIFSDYAPREGWKLGTQISLCNVTDPHALHSGQWVLRGFSVLAD